MSYILLIVLSGAGASQAPAVIQQEFNDAKRCEVARNAMLTSTRDLYKVSVAVSGCFPK